ncbi:SepM family pheromone-processing serine protease [Alkalicoccus daliensis]|uniref:endopeptidase La n=1 Tax=Alkalicoccus daliensis TaxID=745820 RepID=A0A1G9ZTT9_9BACI|nr:SepM family pheromone-processing serine protease [Alkalicoccus daliensis]SDN24527.1 PDZ domain-containing protein [Alkalicoccus daliensis]
MENQETNSPGKFSWVKWVILFAVLIAVNFVQLPYYFSVPGDAQVLTEVIEVEEGYDYEGSFALTTIRMGQANPVNYVWSLLSDRRELMHEDQIRPPGETDEMYQHRQMMLMTSSQEQAILVAYDAAGKEAEFEEYGVLVTGIISGMDAEGKLEAGDLITSINGEEVTEVNSMFELLEDAEIGDTISVGYIRDEEPGEAEIEMQEFPAELGAEEGAGGLGISNPVTDRDLIRDPEVEINTDQIGGPSAGLMFALEIYNQLTEKDITHGLHIAGTGSIDEEGNVGRIGGVKQKVYASDEDGMDVFFVPVEEGAEDSNYIIASNTAQEIDTDMEIVPVGHFQEALDYLNSLEEE